MLIETKKKESGLEKIRAHLNEVNIVKCGNKKGVFNIDQEEM